MERLQRRNQRCLRLALAGLVAATLLGGCSSQGVGGEGDNSNSPGGLTGSPASPPPPSGEAGLPPFEPAPLSVRRLLGWQYRQAIVDLLGAAAGEAVAPPPDSAVNGFDSIGAAQLALSPAAVNAYERSAFAAAQAALGGAGRTALVGCSPRSAADAECLRAFLTRFGRRAWRRPLSAEELNAWGAVGQQAASAYSDFYRGVEFTVAGLLQSPHFLYLVEVGEPDPANPSRLRLTGYELASRMSFFLAGTTPGEELLAAAERGELATAEGLRAQARRLLEQPEARQALARFFDEHLHLRELPGLAKDPAAFPMFNEALGSAMREETQRLLEEVVWTADRDFREAFDADYTYVNPALASLYGLSNGPKSGFARVQLPGGRGGLLGQASFLSYSAHTTTSSPTLRGKFIRERILCEPVAAPPSNVDTSFPAPKPGEPPRTMREKLVEHQRNPACAGCHQLMDPIGLGLESFDAVGRFREEDNGATIDPTGVFDRAGQFIGPRQLGRLLREDERTVTCLSRNVFRMATGHVDTWGEQRSLVEVDKAFQRAGYRMKELLVEIVASDAFRYASQEEVQP